jgi:DNA-binding response OmpR family regulator
LRRDPHIALLLTDVGLPGGLNGRQVAEQARELRPELRVLFTTGYARQAFADDRSLGPGYGLLRKPYLRAEVAARVRELLDTPVWRPRETTTALIVEDEPLLREMLSSVLKSLGFEVIEAGGTAEAEELLASSALHVAIIDQSLGDGIGENVARLARNLHPGLPIVMATGFAKEELVMQGLTTTGPTVVLSKPYSLASLSRVLAEIGVPSPAS